MARIRRHDVGHAPVSVVERVAVVGERRHAVEAQHPAGVHQEPHAARRVDPVGQCLAVGRAVGIVIAAPNAGREPIEHRQRAQVAGAHPLGHQRHVQFVLAGDHDHERGAVEAPTFHHALEPRLDPVPLLGVLHPVDAGVALAVPLELAPLDRHVVDGDVDELARSPRLGVEDLELAAPEDAGRREERGLGLVALEPHSALRVDDASLHQPESEASVRVASEGCLGQCGRSAARGQTVPGAAHEGLGHAGILSRGPKIARLGALCATKG